MKEEKNLWNSERVTNIRPKVDHYTRGNIECIDYIMDKNLNFNLGNVIKYVTRAGFKDDKLEDLGKAKDYIEFEIERVKNESNVWNRTKQPIKRKTKVITRVGWWSYGGM